MSPRYTREMHPEDRLRQHHETLLKGQTGIAATIQRWAARKFGGVTADLLLESHELEAVKTVLGPARRRVWLILIPVMLVLIGSILGLIWLAATFLDRPVDHPLLDERTRMMWVGGAMAGVFTSLFVAVMLEKQLLAAMSGLPAQTFVRYWATTQGWLPWRQIVFLSILFVPMLGFSFALALRYGTVVDRIGLSFNTSLIHRSVQSYADVQSITVFQALNAPVGVVQRVNLVVQFRDGTQW